MDIVDKISKHTSKKSNLNSYKLIRKLTMVDWAEKQNRQVIVECLNELCTYDDKLIDEFMGKMSKSAEIIGEGLISQYTLSRQVDILPEENVNAEIDEEKDIVKSRVNHSISLLENSLKCMPDVIPSKDAIKLKKEMLEESMTRIENLIKGK